MTIKLRKIILPIFIIVYALLFTACSSEPIEGEDLIEAARDAYTALDSAKVEIVNCKTGVAEQEFVFKYDETDYLTYYYYGVNGDEIYQQFNNAFEQFTNDCGELSYTCNGRKDFQRYIRGERLTYAYADRGLIVFQKKAVEDITTEVIDGKTVVTHTYNVKKLSGAEGVKKFWVVYYFNEDNTLDTFIENTVMTENGQDVEYSYQVVISEKNNIDQVPCPFSLDENENVVLKNE